MAQLKLQGLFAQERSGFAHQIAATCYALSVFSPGDSKIAAEVAIEGHVLKGFPIATFRNLSPRAAVLLRSGASWGYAHGVGA
jgi:hypothetical protein